MSAVGFSSERILGFCKVLEPLKLSEVASKQLVPEFFQKTQLTDLPSSFVTLNQRAKALHQLTTEIEESKSYASTVKTIKFAVVISMVVVVVFSLKFFSKEKIHSFAIKAGIIGLVALAAKALLKYKKITILEEDEIDGFKNIVEYISSFFPSLVKVTHASKISTLEQEALQKEKDLRKDFEDNKNYFNNNYVAIDTIFAIDIQSMNNLKVVMANEMVQQITAVKAELETIKNQLQSIA